jgi:mannitol-1-phosphate/altronate dehydrogenase
MIDLNNATLGSLPSAVQRFSYDRSAVTAGIVHLSVGNFHRAHQAWYLDRLLGLPGNERWGLCGVGLIDDATERLKTVTFPQQDNLYTLTQYPPEGEEQVQVIGSIVDYLFAPGGSEEVLAKLSHPAIRIVSMTITEGGYNQDKRTGEYRLDAPATMAELKTPRAPRSAFGFIVEALRRRREAGTAPFTVLSCDNLRNNGAVARSAVLSHAKALDPELGRWIEANVTFPSSMVDRITPAVLKADAERINHACGVADRLPVFSEDFAQWVVEDKFCNGRPPLELVDVQMVDDVHPYELAKVRLLNASHSMLAYPGQLAGLTQVNQALAEPLIRRLLEEFMEQDVIVHLRAPPGMDLHAYKDKLLARFSNPAIGDQLARISSDGAAKLPVFLGSTTSEVISAGGDMRRIALGLACFVRYLGGVDDNGKAFQPFEPNLDPADKALALDDDPRAALRMSLLHGFGITEDGPFAETFIRLRTDLAEKGALATLAGVLDQPSL